MKKILFYTGSNMSLSGVSVVYMSIVRELSRLYRFDIIICENDDLFFEKEFISYGGRIFHFSSPMPEHSLFKKIKWLLYDYPKATKHFVKENINLSEYVAIHSFQELYSYPLFRIASKYGVPKRLLHICSAGSAYPRSKKLKARIMHMYQIRSMKLATNILFVSEAALKYNNYRQKGFVLYNIYDEAKYGAISNNKGNKLILTQIGTFSSRKNQLFSLEVLKKIIDVYPNAKLNIVGKELEQGYLNKINKYIELNNLGNNATILGTSTDRLKLNDQTSYILYPSTTESFGLVLIESQAAGIHCFANKDLPRDADMGNVDFLKLDSDLWCKKIVEYFDKNGNQRKKPLNINKFSKKAFIETLCSLYKNN